MSSPKEFKWAVQRTASTPLAHVKNGKQSGRVQKRIKTTTSKKPASCVEQLENDLSFADDTMATLTVHFESVYNAYKASLADVEKTSCETRLGEMEKELLAAYSDISLQAVHFERKVAKLEQRLSQLRSATTMPNTAVPHLSITPSLQPLPSLEPPAADYQYQSPTSTVSSAPWSYHQDESVLSFPDTPSSFVTDFDSFPFPAMFPVNNTCTYNAETFPCTTDPFLDFTDYTTAPISMPAYPLYEIL